MIWLAIPVLTILVVALGLWPLLRPSQGQDALEQAVAYYEARRDELSRQRAAGVLSDADFAAAEAEQARRLIAADRALKRRAAPSPAARAQMRKIAALGYLVLLPALSLGIYARLGQPGVPDQPMAARPPEMRPFAFEDALAKIEAHLAKNPDDGKGYEVVAPVYMRLGRFEDAVLAHRRIIALLGETPGRFAELGESLVALADGVISQEARAAFEAALSRDAGFAKARFYLALAREQDGAPGEAVAALKDLAQSLPDGAPKARVEAELERLGAANAPPASSNPAETEAGRGLIALDAPERETAIRGMVEGLASRLEAGGGPLEDWQKLIRARLVLKERDKASAHLAAARQAFAGDAAALGTLDTFARDAGLDTAQPEAKPKSTP